MGVLLAFSTVRAAPPFTGTRTRNSALLAIGRGRIAAYVSLSSAARVGRFFEARLKYLTALGAPARTDGQRTIRFMITRL